MSIKQQIEFARRELLDMGLGTNPLLNYRSNAKSVDIVDEIASQTFDILINENKSMYFLPLPEAYRELYTESQSESDTDDSLPPLETYLEDNVGVNRHKDSHLQTKLTPEKLEISLIKIENEAHTLLQEQGIEVLYLALGFLKWFEDKNSDIPYYAPLILLPVELQRTSAKAAFSIQFTQADFGSNLALAAKLKGEFRVDLPTFGDELDVEHYMQSVRSAIEAQERWQVLDNQIALGLFSFGKFQMYADLDEGNWPQGKSLLDQPLLKALFETGFVKDTEQLEGLPNHENVREPEKLHLVKDADSSQTKAILAVMEGSNLVIQGPPGTGKSQTITNVIAEALAKDKKVLFVAQKMAALKVVKKRLDESHLGDAVLELHSHKSTKKTVLDSLKRTFEQGKPQVPDRQQHYERLTMVRGQLDQYVNTITKPILQSGLDYIGALGHYLDLQQEEDYRRYPQLSFDMLRDWDSIQLAEAERGLIAVKEHIDSYGIPSENPYFVSTRTALSPIEQQRIERSVADCKQTLEDITRLAQQLSQEIGLDKSKTLHDVDNLYQTSLRALQAPKLAGVNLAADAWQQHRNSVRQLITDGQSMTRIFTEYKDRFITQAFTAVMVEIKQGLVGRVDKWWRIFSPRYWKAKSALQAYVTRGLTGKPIQWLEWVDDLLRYQTSYQAYQELQTLGQSLFADQWHGKDSDWKALGELSEWVLSLYDDIADAKVDAGIIKFLSKAPTLSGWKAQLAILNDAIEALSAQLTELYELVQVQATAGTLEHKNIDLQDLSELLAGWQNVEKLYEASRYNQIQEILRAVGLSEIIPLAAEWHLPTECLLPTLKASYYAGLVNDAYNANPCIQQFDRVHHERLIQEFRHLDGALFDFAKEALVSHLHTKLPNYNAPGEMDLLRREFTKKRRHIPIRRLLSEATAVIQQAKPVFMMSPMSVATYLPPGKVEFDLVIFDEASQIPAPDALGAIARGKQVIVVGDSKQMPPTNFFGRAVEFSDEEADESTTADVESILGLMLSKGVPEAMLRWHYRSRHHSLIAVSNNQFYNDKLMIFPSPGSHPEATGLSLNILTDTVYGRGSTRSNPLEAEHIAKAVLLHAKHRPHLSLGVVAFSTSQRDAILFALERLRRVNAETENFFSHHEGGDEFFVKNLENVQGDERDVIFVSIGYGKMQSGQMTQNFGPVNKTDGERRLNVLISRARMAMQVYCNFSADDIRVTADTPFGVKALQVFLNYAATGQLETSRVTGKEHDSPFEVEVHNAIEQLGYDAEPQVGSSGFYIDLAVRDPNKPGRFILAVECDGASYHSSASARDRDRIRQSVLEGLGWRFHRIWSTDWFRNAAGEIERLKQSIQDARNAVDSEGLPTDSSPTMDVAAPLTITRNADEPEIRQVAVPKYQYVCPEELELAFVSDIDELSDVDVQNAILKLVHIESPICLSLLSSRISSAVGFSRIGAKLKNSIKEWVIQLVHSNKIRLIDDFIYANSEKPIRLRDWSALDSAMRKIEYVSEKELENAIFVTVRDAVSIESDDCIAAALALIGFQRVTAKAKQQLHSIIQGLLYLEELREVNGRLQLGVTENSGG
ncbi:DNA/RNA helicase [Oleiphilus messinensis]|uniref:DNA/RNA helicase n=1 Tax=Oleiphilus messinensis TaxID=141451 RepID=A0A1Y0IHD6_9GAMM|nr:DUF3320 domain-containing protein [Oleiphilus messinensis]ARU58955.1 DNA/RNA helicase [Oleiphilus messinensis]